MILDTLFKNHPHARISDNRCLQTPSEIHIYAPMSRRTILLHNHSVYEKRVVVARTVEHAFLAIPVGFCRRPVNLCKIKNL